MRKTTTFVAVLVALATTGCADILGPVAGTHIEIDGPSRAYGQPVEFVGLIETDRFECEYVLVVEATQALELEERPEPTRWSAGVIRTYGAEGAEIGRTIMSRRDIEGIFRDGYRPGDRRESRSFTVEAGQLPFRWSVELEYFDPQSGDTRAANFSSRCLSGA